MEELSAQVVRLSQHSSVPALKAPACNYLQGKKRLIYPGLPISPGGENVASQSLSPERVTMNQIPL